MTITFLLKWSDGTTEHYHRRILSRVAASDYISLLTFRSLSDILCSEECPTKEAFQYVERILLPFRAVKNFLLVHL